MRQLLLALLAGGLLIAAGVLLERNRNDHLGTQSYSQLLQSAKRGTRAHVYLELTRRDIETGRFPDALSYARRAQELDHDNAEAFFFEGHVLRLLGRHDDAITPLKHAVALNRNIPQAYMDLGLAYNKSGHLKQAIEAFREYVDREPEDDFGYFWLGAAALSAGMFDIAERSLRRARALNPDRAVTHIALGNLTLRRNPKENDLERALEYYQRAAFLDPSDAEPVELIATVYYRQHKYADAAREFERALRIDPQVAEVYYPLGLAYAKMGEKAKSQRCLKIAEVYASGKEAFVRPGGAVADTIRRPR